MEVVENENQVMIKQMVKDFADKEIRPHFMEWDESQEFPVPLFKKLGELGLMGVLVPTEYGGSGFGYNEYITVISEIAQVCGSIVYQLQRTTLYVQVISWRMVLKSKKENTFQN